MSAPMVDLPEDAYLSHVSKGRLRLKIPSRKRDAGFFIQLQTALSTVPGFEQVQGNPLSGSLLILHADPVELPEVIASLKKTSPAPGLNGNSSKKPNTVYRKVTSTFRQVNKGVRGFTGGELDVPTLSFIALLAVGIYQISRKNFTAPAWYTAFWYALNIFLKSKKDNGQETGII
jgi:Heavy metal associated domain 2